MTRILYCEDDADRRAKITSALRESFPTHDLTSAETVRDGLQGITGIDLHPRYLSEISSETIEQRLRDSGANLSDLGIVITDGGLIDPFVGARGQILDGWDLAQILRNLGYPGKIVYTGLKDIPTSKESLFDVMIPKFEVEQIIDYARACLE